MESFSQMVDSFNFRMGALFGSGLTVVLIGVIRSGVYVLCIRRRATAGVERVARVMRVDGQALRRRLGDLHLRRRRVDLERVEQPRDEEDQYQDREPVDEVDLEEDLLRLRLRRIDLEQEERPRGEEDQEPEQNRNDDNVDIEEELRRLDLELDEEPGGADDQHQDQDRVDDFELGRQEGREHRRAGEAEEDASLLVRCLRALAHGYLLISAAAVEKAQAIKDIVQSAPGVDRARGVAPPPGFDHAAARDARAEEGLEMNVAARGITSWRPEDHAPRPFFQFRPYALPVTAPTPPFPSVDCGVQTGNGGPCAPRGITSPFPLR